MVAKNFDVAWIMKPPFARKIIEIFLARFSNEIEFSQKSPGVEEAGDGFVGQFQILQR